MPARLSLKRAYAKPDPDDGFRVLVDRLWPRGLRKSDAKIDLWLREIAPSPALRLWFGHKADRWEVFQDRYRTELASNPAVATLRGIDAAHVTLIYAAKDEAHNHALVLLDFLRGASSRRPA
jgi:uncharacterized protein YeaO (DUF488 family)